MSVMGTMIFWGTVFTIAFVAKIYVKRVAGWGLGRLLLASVVAAGLLQTFLVIAIALMR